MNEQDKKVLQLYLNDIKKKKIFLLFFILILIVSILFYGFYAKNKQTSNDIEAFIREDIQNNIINGNTVNKETTSNHENTILKENKVDETPKDNSNVVTKEENTKQQIKEKTKGILQETSTSKEDNNKKPANKDFLFTDGYTMENVTQAAQDYLKSYDFSGECVPIKDNEGVYLGMRVIFY